MENYSKENNDVPRISIIVPSFNQGTYIKKTLDSILDQNYPNLEIIVIDGGSTDNTISVLKSYREKLKWVSEKDNGQTEAINKGIRLTSGEIFGYINSDDFMLPGSLWVVANSFVKGVLWVTGDYIIVNENGQSIQKYIVLYKRFLRFFSSRFIFNIANFVAQPSTFWKREILDNIGYFDEQLRYAMDYDFLMRSFYVLPKIIHYPLSAFRIHKYSKGGSQFYEQFK
jgi:glycosyltransferase involved in cell wall biosynthesis